MKSKKAFTLIELLVVIAIIGLLATISVVALNNARAKARDAKRVADVKQVQTALELFFNDKGRYPTADEFNSGSIFSTTTGATTTYMAIIPAAASPADGSCSPTNNQYVYNASSDGTTYTLSYCLGGPTGSVASGSNCATPAGITNGTACAPAAPVLPPGLTGIMDFNGANGFYPYGSPTVSGNTIYGMTGNGGSGGLGTVFSVNIDGTNYRDLMDFNGPNGSGPRGSLIISGGILYGMTAYGGVASQGNIFSIDTNGNNFHDLFDFDGTNGSAPNGSLLLAGSTLYGTTVSGGVTGQGNIFSIDTNGNNFHDLKDFHGTDGAYPYGDLIISGNILYGFASYGGLNNFGALFSIHTDGSNYDDIYDFVNASGSAPYGTPVLSGGVIYGLAVQGGLSNYGTVFSVNVNGSNYRDLYDFNAAGGAYPYGSITLYPGNVLYGMTYYFGAHYQGTLFSINTNGSNYQDLLDFDSTNGGYPYFGHLVVSGNSLYGMTLGGGASHQGNIFAWTP